MCTLFGHTHAVQSIAFTPDRELLASGSWDKTVKLWVACLIEGELVESSFAPIAGNKEHPNA
ncbi:MAG: WD40 domain-containing protein [Brasilonema octagenarum HA4186-MV1]|uniref:Uncharacterized protein n=1 Tax=Brasilonema octagenarum UFV-OR1 TaxID=417115 RepID=A0ABX1M8J4_9CYAN|nr:WD40 domain-containing protein [Brasilonema octagenarum HA4186-MV1]NMF63763.1 hypothetical protein [Brasilonema octagenarum UFV-OR1]